MGGMLVKLASQSKVKRQPTSWPDFVVLLWLITSGGCYRRQ